MSTIPTLLTRLEDPFDMFPLHEVAEYLTRSVAEADRLMQSFVWPGVSVKYRTVAEEHQDEVIFHLIGSVFVLGQTSITQTVSIVRKVRELAGCPSWIPASKADILKSESMIHSDTGLSEIVLFNAVANYYKHHYEWPSDWERSQTPRQETMQIVSRLGLSFDTNNNLEVAVRNLGLSTTTMVTVGERIQAWRERLGKHLRMTFAERSLS